jgi:hypothetical protein
LEGAVISVAGPQALEADAGWDTTRTPKHPTVATTAAAVLKREIGTKCLPRIKPLAPPYSLDVNASNSGSARHPGSRRLHPAQHNVWSAFVQEQVTQYEKPLVTTDTAFQ